jgi:hypothetical protein
MLAQPNFLPARDISIVCFHDGFDLVRHGYLFVSYCFFCKEEKIANPLTCQGKFIFFALFFKMFTEIFFIHQAIAAFESSPGIAVACLFRFVGWKKNFSYNRSVKVQFALRQKK